MAHFISIVIVYPGSQTSEIYTGHFMQCRAVRHNENLPIRIMQSVKYHEYHDNA